MGVSGAGKTTLSRRLAERLNGHFLDGDDLHSKNSIEKMRQGKALSDQDREPWLERIVEHASLLIGHTPVIIACSALKTAYRERLAEIPHRLVHLEGTLEECSRRLRSRPNHFASEKLLPSQFRDLERPEGAIVIPIAWSSEQAVNHIICELGMQK